MRFLSQWGLEVKQRWLTHTMERQFNRNIEALTEIFQFLQEASDLLSLDAAASFSMNMVVEELFTNMVKYNGNGADNILVGVSMQNSDLVIDLIDFDSEPFDYSEREEVDITAPLHKRKPGGLGIHLVKQFMDEVRYEYKDRKTSIHLVKKLNSDA